MLVLQGVRKGKQKATEAEKKEKSLEQKSVNRKLKQRQFLEEISKHEYFLTDITVSVLAWHTLRGKRMGKLK